MAILDVDGTPVDTTYLHCLAWQRVCRDRGLGVPAARLHRRVGRGADTLVPPLIGHADDGLSSAHDRHVETLVADAAMLPGADDFLQRLVECDVWRVLATSGHRDMTDHLLGLVPGARVPRSDRDR